MRMEKIYLTTATVATIFLILISGSNRSYEPLKKNLENAKAYTLAVVEAMPDENLNYQPTREVRSFAAQAYHIAYTIEFQNEISSGKSPSWNPGDENSKTKKELIEWIEKGFERMEAILKNAPYREDLVTSFVSFLDHNAHHRGQMVVYLRMNGIVPPSYR